MLNSPNESVAMTPAMLVPKRNPGLIARIANAVFRADPAMGPQAAEKQTTQSGSYANALASIYDQFFKNQAERLAVYRDVDEMDNSSEEVSVALDHIANNTVTSEDGSQMSFVATSEDAKVQKVLDDTVESSGIHKKVYRIARSFLKYGDFFGEIVVNGQAQIVDLKTLPPATMYRNQDARGELFVAPPKYDPSSGECLTPQGTAAYDQLSEDTKRVLAAFYPFQILHLRHNWDGVSRYGTSLLKVTRIVWRKLKALEEGLMVGRLTRDLMKLVFYVDTTGLSPAEREEALRKFRESVTQSQRMDGRRENPFSVMTDIFLATGTVRVGGQNQQALTRVDVIDPKNTGQHEIGDIEYFQTKMLATLVIPRNHINMDKGDDAKGILTSKDVQYVRFLRHVQDELTEGLRQFFDTALVLAGVDPESAKYDITWPALKATDEAAAAQTYLAYAQGDQLMLQEGVLDQRYLMKHRFNLSDEEIDEMSARIEEQRQQKLEQQQAQQQQAHEQQLDLVKAQTSAHQDRDGQRKGDEGRTRDGQRIAPTKSKKDTPPGSGSRTMKQEATLLAEMIRDRTMDRLEGQIKALLEAA